MVPVVLAILISVPALSATSVVRTNRFTGVWAGTSQRTHGRLMIQGWDYASGQGYPGDQGWLSCTKYHCHFSRRLKTTRSLGDLLRRLLTRPSEMLPYYRGLHGALILGDGAGLAKAIRDRLRAFGLVHLVVVSGLHVSFLAQLAERLLLILILPLGFFPVIGYRLRPVMGIGIHFMVLGLVLAYVVNVAPGPAGYRALLLAVLANWFRHCRLSTPRLKMLVLGFVLHTLLFFQDFASKGFLLSWGAYIFILGERGSGWSVYRFVRIQTKISCLCLAVLGQFAPGGFLANALMAVLFPPLFATVWLSGLADKHLFNMAWLYDGLEWSLSRVAALPSLPIFQPSPLYGAIVNWCFVLISAWMVADSLRKLSQTDDRKVADEF